LAHLLRHVGREAVRWLLIDEAGQASPQSAVGAIWRARHTVAVGDPLQLEPIDQLPLSIRTILREHNGVPAGWLPANPSVQALADQVAPAGTCRGGRSEEAVWVGAPLNVHRRCEEPMFTIVNGVAYQGQMINCTPKRAACELPSSAWIDVASSIASGHWIPAEGEVLRALLEQLRARGTDFSGVFAISPFRDVARRMRPLKNDYEGLTAGTIHTAQGREADVVILVLGGNARRPGAMAWAAQKPNMLNVAVSRARRRLYVIGDRAAWSVLPHFDVLAESLESERAVRALAEGPARR
jgi:superfamily I DNA and/or RNA helicase